LNCGVAALYGVAAWRGSTLPDACDRIIFWGLVFLIGFTPAAFGTVEPWSTAIMEWGITTLLLILMFKFLRPGSAARGVRPRLTGLEWPIGLFLLLCALQTVPLPIDVLRKVAPGSARLYAQPSLEIESPAPGADALPPRSTGLASLCALDPARPRPVSVHPRVTWERLRVVGVLAGLFMLIAAWADEARKIVSLLAAVTAVGFLVAVQGLIQLLTWNGRIYWVRKVPSSSAFGPFVNHNHFAGYVEMVIPVALTLAFFLLRAQGRAPLDRTEAKREAGALDFEADGLVTLGGRWGQGALALFASVLLVVALFFSLSRGGWLSTLFSGLILSLLMWRRIESRRLKLTVVVVLPLLVAALVGWVGAEGIGRQIESGRTLQSEASYRYRLMIWKAASENLKDFRWLGSGLGTFEDSFAPFTPPGASRRWDRAHNDYLQLVWETGLAGGLLALIGAAVYVRRYWWPAVRSRPHALDLLRLGVAAALMSIALHSFVDFNLQIGANGFLFALLAGLLVALRRVIEGEPGGRHPISAASRGGT